MSIRKHGRPPGTANAILVRMRRRTGRLGALVVALTVLLAALVIFAVCACKGVRL
jgi:hypothetical protein